MDRLKGHIFFDLDHTLWDFEKNSRETLHELVGEHREKLPEVFSFDAFYQTYIRINHRLWEMYRNHEIEADDLRRTRFRDAFEASGADAGGWVTAFGDEYIRRCPYKKGLIPFANEALDRLRDHFHIHIITNGFREIQHIKIRQSGLNRYISEIITSEDAGTRKPDIKIFQYAARLTGAVPANSIYIGDDYECDVIGGQKAGFRSVFFNRTMQKNPDRAREIKCLSEIENILKERG